MRVLKYNQSTSTQFPVTTFSQMALFGSRPACNISEMSEKVGHM